MDRQTGKSFKNKLLSTKTALLVIDMQNDFISSEGYLGKKGQNLEVVQKTVPAVQSMIGHFRRNGMKVIYTQTVHHKYTNTENWVSRTSQKSLDPSYMPFWLSYQHKGLSGCPQSRGSLCRLPSG